MSGLTKEEFENVLIDVRKAYRLLFLYQKRILDLIQFIGDTLDFRFGGGWNWFTNNLPTGSKTKLTGSAWDWLSMYFYEFNFSEKNINGSRMRFSVIIQSDTGFFDTMNNYENINSYSPIDQSETKLIFIAGKNIWWDPDFKDLFNNENMELYKTGGNDLILTNENGKLIVKSFLLSRFINSEETNKCINEWLGFLKENQINEIVQI